jgi:hypothetical protein
MPEYQLYCFAQSGNAYRAALMLNLRWASANPLIAKLICNASNPLASTGHIITIGITIGAASAPALVVYQGPRKRTALGDRSPGAVPAVTKITALSTVYCFAVSAPFVPGRCTFHDFPP